MNAIRNKSVTRLRTKKPTRELQRDVGNERRVPLNSVSRAFALLELLAFSDAPLPLVQISKGLRLAPSTVHRFLRSLMALGFVSQDRRTEHYQATLKLFNLGSMVISRFNLSERLLPAMRRVADQTGELVSLTFRESFEGVVLERVVGKHGVPVFNKYRRMPLYCTAAGKAILAGFDKKSLETYLSRTQLKRRTAFTLTDAASIRQEIINIRRQGMAVDNQELEMGAKCVAVPLILANGMVAAISVSALAPRMTNKRMREIVQILNKALGGVGFSGDSYPE